MVLGGLWISIYAITVCETLIGTVQYFICRYQVFKSSKDKYEALILCGNDKNASDIDKRIGSSISKIPSGVVGHNVGWSTKKPGRTVLFETLLSSLLNSCALVPFFFATAGQDIRDRLTGAADPLSRRNMSTGGRHKLFRNRTSEDIPSSKDVVLCLSIILHLHQTPLLRPLGCSFLQAHKNSSRVRTDPTGPPLEYTYMGDCDWVCDYCCALFWYEERLKVLPKRGAP